MMLSDQHYIFGESLRGIRAIARWAIFLHARSLSTFDDEQPGQLLFRRRWYADPRLRSLSMTVVAPAADVSNEI